jgi:hypothetical protein
VKLRKYIVEMNVVITLGIAVIKVINILLTDERRIRECEDDNFQGNRPDDGGSKCL